MTHAVAVVWRFNPTFGPVRRVSLLKIYSVIIPTYMMVREIIPHR